MSVKRDDLEKIKVKDHFYQYYFFDDNGEPNSIFAAVDETGKKALILDTAFPGSAEKVRKDLADQGIQPEIVVLSHYHPDHSAGLTAFKDCRIYAGEFYEDNYENCRRWSPDLTFIRPTHTLKNGDTLFFGTFRFKFFHAPGHSRCMMLTLIDDVLYIGDLLMFGEDDKLCLPYISLGGSYNEYIESLERIKTLDYKLLILAHGHFLTDKDKINNRIDDYLYYLNRVKDSMGTLPLAVCLKNDISTYLHTEYHDNNLMYLDI